MAFDIRNTGFKLPSGWQFIRLGDIAKINGKTLTKKSALTDIRYIDISSTSTGKFEEPTLIKIEDAPSRAKRILTNNDIIISTVRPNLKQFAFIEEAGSNLIASTGFCVISADSEKLAWYLYALITSDIFTAHLVAVADGAAYPAFNPIEIEDAVIALPPENYLDVIVDVTRAIHKKIHLNTQTNQTLEQTAQALYKSWFVDFEPTRAKAAVLAAGGSQEEAETAAMSALSGHPPAALAALARQNPARHQQLATLAAAFPSALVSIDSYGEVPAGWEYHKADELFDIGIGKTPPRKEKEWFSDKPSNVQWISIKDMGNAGIYITDSSEYLTKEAVDKFNIRLIPENTVIFSFKLTVGRVSITTTTTTTNEAIAHFKKREDSFLTSEYLYLFFKSFNFSRLGNTSSIATAVNSKTIRDIQILCPSKTILDGFQTYMAALFRKIKQQTLENRSLSEIRDTLLPKLLNGELPADTSFQTASEAV